MVSTFDPLKADSVPIHKMSLGHFITSFIRNSMLITFTFFTSLALHYIV